MKYWTGYLTAAIFAAFTWALQRLGKSLTVLLDAVYPYVSRSMQSVLASWSGGVDFCLWQVLLLVAIAVLLVTVVLMIVFRWNPVRWLGWVLAAVSIVFFSHTLVWGLNYYAGPLAEDIRLETVDPELKDMEKAAIYYRDQANAYANTVERDGQGNVKFDEFDALAEHAGEGFYQLTYDKKLSVFAGPREPVKKLSWGKMYTSMGVSGMTFPLTGEAAVNPDIPAVSMPFVMCREMARRMCIANDRDADFAAFLAGSENPDNQFRYSAYFMAYRYCIRELESIGNGETSEMAARIRAEQGDALTNDLLSYDDFYKTHKDKHSAAIAEKADDIYRTTSGKDFAGRAYNSVPDLLVGWYIQQVVQPGIEQEEVDRFDPTDVDLNVTLPPEETESEEAE